MELNEKDYPVSDLISFVIDSSDRLYLQVSEESIDHYCGGYKYNDIRFRLDDKEALRLIDVLQTLMKRNSFDKSVIAEESSTSLNEEEIF